MRIIKWIGQKFNIAEWIISHFPEHKVYVEPFGGSMAVLLSKIPSEMEVYNDIDKMLSTFFLYVKKHPWALLSEMELLPPSREIMNKIKEDLRKGYLGDTELERVVRWWYLNMNSINGIGKVFSAKYSVVGKSVEKLFLGRILEVSSRLKDVVIENLDYKEVIKKYDSSDTLFYVDPPYLLDSKRAKEYYGDDAWDTLEAHQELYEVVSSVKGKVCISYYPNPTLKEWYSKEKGWFWDFKETITTGNPTARPKRTEWLIMNYDWREIAKQKTLFTYVNTKRGEGDHEREWTVQNSG